MSALPRSTTQARNAPRLVREPEAATPLAIAWELSRAGERVELRLDEQACELRLVTTSDTRVLHADLRVEVESDALGLTHLDASGELREQGATLGTLRLLLTLAPTSGSTRLLYVHTNALELLAIPGGRADVALLKSLWRKPEDDQPAT